MRTIFIFFIFLIFQRGVLQAQIFQNHSYVFQSDSLSGFEEDAAKRSAISEGFLGEEFKVRMWQLKRVYVNSKYGIITKKDAYLNFSNNNKYSTATPACINEDFESSPSGSITSSNQITGWTVTEGSSMFPSNNCNLSGCCPNAPIEAQIVTAPVSGYIDPVIGTGYPIHSVFGTSPNAGLTVNPTLQNMYGSNFIKINNNSGNFTVEKLSKTFVVSASNYLFQVAYIAVLFNAPHACCDADAFQIKLTNVTTSSTLSCPGFSTSGLSSACSPTSVINFFDVNTLNPSTASSIIIFNKWRITSLDLSAYIGQTITIDIIATDCTGGGHYAYAYVDAQCSTMSISSNNSPIASNSPSVTLPTCGFSTVTIIAPQGLGPYSWAGPAVSNPYNTLLFSNQIFTTNVSGNYTLTMAPPGACSQIGKVLTVSVTPSPLPLSISGNTSICTNAIANITVNGASTYTWNNGLNSNTLSVSPLTTTTYSVVSSDLNNCQNSATLIVMVNPIPVISTSGINTVCIGSSTNYTCTGAISYSLNSIPVTNPINILPVATSIYTISGTNAANCSITQTVSVNVNTTCANVWPGDANSDGVCNNLDVLELGLHFTQAGPVRTVSNNLWQSYFANNWLGIISNGKNLNHSDCNGDGVIDQNDTLAIYNNYNLTHAFKYNEENSIDPQLNFIPDQSIVHSGEWGSASVYLGDIVNPVNAINGLAFKINFDKTYIEQDSVYLDYPNSFLNANNQNLNFRKKQFSGGVIFCATTHTNNVNVSGNGKVAVFYFKVNPNLGFDTLFHFNLSTANQSNSNGFISPLTISSSSVVAIGNTVGLKENRKEHIISIFPNPTNGIVTIKSGVEMQKIEVLNSAGQILIFELIKNKTHQLHLGSLEKGIYFIKIFHSNGSVNVKKVVTID